MGWSVVTDACCWLRKGWARTLVKHVAQRAIVQDHDLTQVRLNRTEVLDEGAVAEGAVLSVVPAGEELPVRLQPVDYGVGVFLYRGRKDDEVVPLADLRAQRSQSATAGQSQEEVHMLTLRKKSSQCGLLWTK